jgi:toxin-antitoxin system PIN domain toxin
MVVAVDTNILVHAANMASPRHVLCARVLEQVGDDESVIALTWPVIYEFLRVATHPSVFAKPMSFTTAWAKVTAMLASPAATLLAETRSHATLVRQCAAEVPRLAGNLVHDFHLAVLMREHGVRDVLTLDKDFRAFPWITVREP